MRAFACVAFDTDWRLKYAQEQNAWLMDGAPDLSAHIEDLDSDD